jgi:hypothetical protein
MAPEVGHEDDAVTCELRLQVQPRREQGLDPMRRHGGER